MIGDKIPRFNSGTILTKATLEDVRDYALAERENAYIGFADGIYRGCEITTTASLLTVNRGIFIYKEQAYYIDKPIEIHYEPTNEWMILKISFLGEEISESYITKGIKVCLGRESETVDNDIELCRFKLQSGAGLRNTYRDFKDLSTQYDTVYEIEAKWSAYGQSSMTPRVLKEFYKEAMKIPRKDPQDMLFLYQIAELKGNTLNRDTILLYVCNKLGWEPKDYSNIKLYEGLNEILNGMRSGRNNMTAREMRERRMIVD
ncbi:MAG: hypothetical protein IKK33_06315 [Lachnospiraceae bacterium]|nr:hypothetical protein [Lachnospiraceae bacterium]